MKGKKQKVFENIMVNEFPHLMKIINTQFHEVTRKSRTRNIDKTV